MTVTSTATHGSPATMCGSASKVVLTHHKLKEQATHTLALNKTGGDNELQPKTSSGLSYLIP